MKSLNQAAVYWIRLPEHTDIYSQGYVGVAKNVASRWKGHLRASKKDNRQLTHLCHAINKYSWDTLVKETFLFGEESFCYETECYLRPCPNIGWNIKSGGNRFPSKAEDPNFWAIRERTEEEKYLEWTKTEEYAEMEEAEFFYNRQVEDQKIRAAEIAEENFQKYLRYRRVKKIFPWIDCYQDD